MSYDLDVFAPREASSEVLLEVVAGGRGLAPSRNGARSWTVNRGSRGASSFTIEGPFELEPEDVPSAVEASVLAAKVLYQFIVEDPTDSEVPHATRCARRLAEALDGAVLDPQKDLVWSRSTTRIVASPPKSEPASELKAMWFCLRDDVGPDAARTLLRLVERYLPEAMPRRFGGYEPLRGKLTDGGIDGFVGAWSEEDSTVFTTATLPCLGGAISGGGASGHPRTFWHVSLDFLAEPFRDPAWRDALRSLFIEVADALPAFYASVELSEGHRWTGRKMVSDLDSDWPISPVSRDQVWSGLPPVDTWWSWLGGPFEEYVDRLPIHQAEPTVKGVFFSVEDEPVKPDEDRGLHAWLPAGLFSTFAPVSFWQRPLPLNPAPVVPDVLRPQA